MDTQHSACIKDLHNGTSTVTMTRYQVEAMGLRPWWELQQWPHQYLDAAVPGDDSVTWQIPTAELLVLVLRYGGAFEHDAEDLAAPYMPITWQRIAG